MTESRTIKQHSDQDVVVTENEALITNVKLRVQSENAQTKPSQPQQTAADSYNFESRAATNGTVTLRKTINSTDKQQRYKSPESETALGCPQQHHSSMICGSGEQEAVINKTTCVSPNQSIENPIRLRTAQRILTTNDVTRQTTSKEQPTTIMGLGHGMGIQLGQDGRFYASMGGQHMGLTSPGTRQEQVPEVTNSYPGPKPHSPQQSSKKLAQKLPSSQKIPALISSNESRNLSERRKQMVRQQQSSAHKVHEKRSEYEEVFNSTNERQKMGSSNVMQSFRQQPFSSSSPGKHKKQQLQVQLQNSKHTRQQSEEVVSQFNSSVATPINQGSMRQSAHVKHQQAMMDQRVDNQQENLVSRGMTKFSVQNHYKASLGAAIAYASQYSGAQDQAQESSAVAQRSPQIQTQRMSSTNESSLTEQPIHTQQLQLPLSSSYQSSYLNGAGQQIIAINPSQRAQLGLLQKDQYSILKSPQFVKGHSVPVEGQIPDTRSYILMKNKVEGDSKQMKHEVAQQIIATVQKNRIAGPAQIHTCRAQQQQLSYGKQMQMQLRASHLPPISQPIVSKTEVVSPQAIIQITAPAEATSLNYTYNDKNEFLDQHLTKQLQSVSLYHNQQPSSQLCKKKNYLVLNDDGISAMIHRHNSMEQLAQNGSRQAVSMSKYMIKGITPGDGGESTPQPAHHSELTPINAAVYKTVGQPHHARDAGGEYPVESNQNFGFRVMSEKCTSQPPRGHNEAPESYDKRNLLLQAIEQQQYNKRNSIQVVMSSRDSNEALSPKKLSQNMAFGLSGGPQQSPRTTTAEKIANPTSEPANSKNHIFKQELTLGGSSIKAADETSEWIVKVTAESPYLSRLQSDNGVSRNTSGYKSHSRPGKKSLVLGQPHINIPALQGAGQQYQLQQKQKRKQPQQLFDAEMPKKPDLTESNVKRARLLLEKKKKLFEKWPMQEPNQTFAERSVDHIAQVEHMITMNGGLMIGNGANNQHNMGFPTEVGKPILNIGGNLVCVPGVTYKSMLPAQVAIAKQQSTLKNFSEHPLSNQQLLNGYSKNTAANQYISRPNRKSNQDRALQANQGIQGKNINIMTQNKVFQNQAQLMRKLKRNQLTQEDSPEVKAMIERALEAPYETPHSQELRNLHMLQQQLLIGNLQLSLTGSRKNLRQSVHAADTGQIPNLATAAQPNFDISQQNGSDPKRKSSFFQVPLTKQQTVNGNQVINNVIVFSHNGQTYIRSNDVNIPVQGLKLDTSPGADQAAADAADALIQKNMTLESQEYTPIRSPISPLSSNNHALLNQSQATMMADKMVQLGIGSRSLSKMLQGAQLEAALAQLAKSGQLGVVTTEQLETAGCIQQVQLLPPPQQSPRMVMKTRARTEKISKLKYTSSPSKHSQRLNGESNGSLSTKPATSTTLSSTQDAKNYPSGKKGGAGAKTVSTVKKDAKQRVHIFHEAEEGGVLRNHKINKAINTINNIIRLIFKNNKDSLAITTTNNTSSLGGPSGNRLIEDTRIAELHKIAKQINIQIPKKFDSKQSLREFFHSREFILTLKIKMQNLLHKAILTANNMPQSVVELNMCNRDASSSAAANGKEESKIYVAKKFYVGPGNNFPIVKSVLKQRYWWQYGNEESFAADCDFIWTSWKKQKHIDFLTNVNNKYRNKKRQKEQAKRKIEEDHDNADKVENKRERDHSDPKMIRKHREKKDKKAGDDKDPAYQQAHVDKVVLPIRLYNRLEQNKQLTNKKGVFVNMRKYYESLGQDPFKVLPITFHTQHGVNDAEFRKFSNYFNALEKKIQNSQQQIKRAIKQYYSDKAEKPELVAKKSRGQQDDYYDEVCSDDEEAIQEIKRKYRAPQNTWIVKPGENTNRGTGITVVKTLRDVQAIIGRPVRKENDKTFIIQKYIDYPLLVHKRKFDFRCFGMLTSINGSLKGYCYQDGYVRTSCREYSLDDLTDPYVHLTNDAIQQRADEYGKFENGNKMSFQDFSKVISAQQPDLDFDFHRDIFPQIQKLVADTYKASFHKIDPHRLQNCFELFGYDFMIDEDFRLYLIEVNTNPSFEVCSPLMARIIPEVLDNCFKIVLDPLFPSPDLSHNRKFQLNELPQEVKFLLVFDENTEGEEIRANFLSGIKGSIVEASAAEEDIESDKEQELAEDDGDDAY